MEGKESTPFIFICA